MLLDSRIITRALLNAMSDQRDPDLVVKSLIDFLERYRSLHKLPEVKKTLQRYERATLLKSAIRVTLARDTDATPEDVAKLIEKFEGIPSRDYQLTIDSDIIGGYIYRSQGRVSDHSIRNALHQLAQTLSV